MLQLSSAQNTLRNLNALLDKVHDAFLELAPETCAHVVMVIDQLSYHNSDDVRELLMDTSLFSTRDTFVLCTLQKREYPLYRRMNALSSVEDAFDSLIVSQPARWDEIKGAVQIFRMLLQVRATALATTCVHKYATKSFTDTILVAPPLY